MSRKIATKHLIYILFLTLTLFIGGFFVFFNKSALADGTIDPDNEGYKYAWGENIGWINFGCDNCNVAITDSGLSGYALSETAGWIYLGDIINDGQGNLSGYAWGENVGWIKFNPDNGGVVINAAGEFTGSALGENIGWIIFDGDYVAKTDWQGAPTISSISHTPEPTNPYRSVTFIINWDDDNDSVKAKVCKENSLTNQNCSVAGYWASSTDFTTANPIKLKYDILEADWGQTRDYYVFTCNDDGQCSDSSSGSFKVNSQSMVPDTNIRGGVKVRGGLRAR